MNLINRRTLRLCVIAASLGLGHAWAEKPAWAGGGQGRAGEGSPPKGQMKKMERGRASDGQPANAGAHAPGPRARAPAIATGGFFSEGQRRSTRQWYGEQYRAGHCPPGLAKKNNGCLPPGQAKKWAMGQPLPASVVYYPVPRPVLVQLGTPPAGHQYVRVANDILLLAIGSRMVIDAITDLGQLP